jgi:hypothetical protein
MRPIGSSRSRRLTPLMTIVVPMVVLYWPGLTAPAATCEAQPSVMPAATGV